LSLLLSCAGACLLVAANAFFVAVEFAIVAVDRTQVRVQAEQGSRRAGVVAGMLEHLSFHLSGAHVARMSLAKMQNKAFNPIGISLLGSDTIMLQADFTPDLIKQLRFLLR
jgi:CBS domain containing-hemolysin-like protein